MKGSCEQPRPSYLISSSRVKINALSKKIIYLSEMVLTTFILDILCIWFPKEEGQKFYQVGRQLLFSCTIFKTRSIFRNDFYAEKIFFIKKYFWEGMFYTFLEKLLAMIFFWQEFKANRDSREIAPLKLPVDGLALLLPEPQYERHPVRTCRWRNIARQPLLWQQTKTKLHFLLQMMLSTEFKTKDEKNVLFYLCVRYWSVSPPLSKAKETHYLTKPIYI
jgi:hypothetical protein